MVRLRECMKNSARLKELGLPDHYYSRVFWQKMLLVILTRIKVKTFILTIKVETLSQSMTLYRMIMVKEV
jgi:hypothetical protein